MKNRGVKNKSNYEIKKSLVEEGKSRIFDDWHKNAGITEAEFLEGLKWLCDSEITDQNQTVRELGCSRKEGLVKLRRVHGTIHCKVRGKEFDKENQFIGFYRYDNDRLWGGSVSISPRDRI